MKINAKQLIKELDGTETELTIGSQLAGLLTIPTDKRQMDILKAYTLAIKFTNQEEVELDNADVEALKTELKGVGKYMSPLIIGQILEILK